MKIVVKTAAVSPRVLIIVAVELGSSSLWDSVLGSENMRRACIFR
jgi:hypothetical protein